MTSYIKNILFKEVIDSGVPLERLLGENKELVNIIPDYQTIDAYIEWIDSLYFLVLAGTNKGGKETRKHAIREAVYYIHQNYHQNISVEKVALHVDKSNNYFSYLFKKEMGMSFVEYLNRIRIDKAKELLNTSTYKTYEISELVGFSDYKYFSSVFKKVEGVSPTQYKNNKS